MIAGLDLAYRDLDRPCDTTTLIRHANYLLQAMAR